MVLIQSWSASSPTFLLPDMPKISLICLAVKNYVPVFTQQATGGRRTWTIQLGGGGTLFARKNCRLGGGWCPCLPEKIARKSFLYYTNFWRFARII